MATIPRKVYLVRAGADGEDEEYALENNLAVIGFRDVPTLAAAKDYDDVFKIVEQAMSGAKPRAIGNRAGQVWAFSVAMKPGDIVVMPRKLKSHIVLGIVSGSYEFREVREELRHTRGVKWVLNVARMAFGQDLLYSFGALLTVCNIARNDAERRVGAILDCKPDPGFLQQLVPPTKSSPETIQAEEPSSSDLQQLAEDQIERHIQSRFSGHALSRLVEAVLKAEGWVTRLSPPGADGGVDILAGRGSLGLDPPRLCVQVKSQTTAVDVTVYRTLQGSMQSYKADQGLLVAWGGFNRVVLAEAKQGHFFVRLWDSRDLVEAIYNNYERLPAEIQADLPLKRVWMVVPGQRES
jgi:restriction system protein